MCLVGVSANIVWFLLLRSYRDLNAAKFKVINDMEVHLPVALFTREWEYLKQDPIPRWRPKYAEQGTVERWAPVLFGAINIVLGISVIRQ